MVCHPGTVVLAEPFQHGVENLVAFVPCEVHVDIRWIRPGHGKKPFEIQVVRDRIHIGYPQCIGDDRGGSGTSTAGPAGHSHDIVHDEEIGGEPLAIDNIQLIGDPTQDSIGDLSIAFFRTFEDPVAQFHFRSRVRHRIFGKYQRLEQGHIGTCRYDSPGVLQCLGPGFENLGITVHILYCLVRRFPIIRGQGSCCLSTGNGAQHDMEVMVPGEKQGCVVNRHKGNPQFAGSRNAAQPAWGYGGIQVGNFPRQLSKQSWGFGGKHQSLGIVCQFLRDIQVLADTLLRQKPAYARIASDSTHKSKYRTFGSRQFDSYHQLHAEFLCRFTTGMQSVEVVPVGYRYGRTPLRGQSFQDGFG